MGHITRSQVYPWLLVGAAVGSFGCPLLLEDDFSVGALSTPDAGEPCIGLTCHVPYSNGGGSSGDGGEDAGGSAGLGGASSGGAGGSSGGAGSGNGGAGAGTGGAAGSGSAGTGSAGSGSAGSGSAGTGSAGSGSAGSGSGGAGGGPPACWTLELTDGSHDSSSNCLGIVGNNKIEKDTNTSLTLSYEDGDPCFTGSIPSSGWGATFELDFAPTGSWDAEAEGVTGFEVAYRGSQQPPSVRVIYKQTGSSTDFCRVISPGTTEVPFSVAHPSCSTSSSTVVDATRLDTLILALVPSGGSSYPVDFCIKLRALD